jgi:hypothetical protein
MSVHTLAVASTKSFGDFVIAHSALHRVDADSKARTRLISCSHVKGLNAILPNDVRVTLMNSGAERVPALFDVKKRGKLAAIRSALSLRRELQAIERGRGEALAFEVLGVRERFIAGRWPVLAPRSKCHNIYETYLRFLAEHGIRSSTPAMPVPTRRVRTVGIFPESRLVEKRLTGATLSLIFDHAARAGLDAKLFILEGDLPSTREFPCVVNISRDFASLSDAIKSVDAVVSADSLPAHLAEYFDRPVFVATSAANEYWLPYGCFSKQYWGIFSDTMRFPASIDRFMHRLSSD